MNDLTSLLASLKTASLLPSPILPSTFTPSISLTISFATITPSNGSLVRVSQVASQPKISISSTTTTTTSEQEKDQHHYTLMLIDPDAPTPADPKFAYWRHWIVTNISLPSSPSSPSTTNNDDITDITASGTTLTPYLAPGPKDESGPHRYLFLLFRQPKGFKLTKEDVGGDEFVERRSFAVGEVVERGGLQVVGVQWMRGVGDGWVGEEGKDEL